MSCELDPKEVLMHLQELGYYNITPIQLKEFISDLEKLIQHDITKRNKQAAQPDDDSASSPLPNTTDESVSSSPPPPSDLPDHAVRKARNVVERVSCSSSESSVAPARRVLRECTKHTSHERGSLLRSQSAGASKPLAKPAKTCDCAWRRIGCKCCEELMSQEQNSLKTKSKENLAPPRPKSSFIRTWQTQAGSYRTQRCDPVALYQQYQQMWKQQKLPGEDNHNDLRWSVRERLLGQQPLPRSCSCGCKCPCKLNEKDLSKTVKKVSSKILPRGPFHIEGRIYGPFGHQKDGDFKISDRQLRGFFEVGSDSGEDKNLPENPPCGSEILNQNSRERAVWLSKQDIESKEERNEKQVNERSYCMTEEEIENLRRKHDRSTCKYCGLIHYMLSSSEGSGSNNKPVRNVYPTEKPDRHPVFDLKKKDDVENKLDTNKNLPKERQSNKQYRPQCGSDVQNPDKNKSDSSSRGHRHQQLNSHKDIISIASGRSKESEGYWRERLAPTEGTTDLVNSLDSSPPREEWPRRFTVQADIHREDVSTTLSPGSRSTRPSSTPVSSCRPARHPDCQPDLNLAAATSPTQSRSQRQSDSYFEARIPVNLKGFQGELKTEVEVHKKHRQEESKCPLVTVATKVKIHKI